MKQIGLFRLVLQVNWGFLFFQNVSVSIFIYFDLGIVGSQTSK